MKIFHNSMQRVIFQGILLLNSLFLLNSAAFADSYYSHPRPGVAVGVFSGITLGSVPNHYHIQTFKVNRSTRFNNTRICPNARPPHRYDADYGRKYRPYQRVSQWGRYRRNKKVVLNHAEYGADPYRSQHRVGHAQDVRQQRTIHNSFHF